MNTLHEENPMIDAQLLSRLVDGSADAADWSRWSLAAAGQADRWRELAEMQADHGRIQRVMARASETAEHVALPLEPHVSPIVLRLSAWSGWAMAAMVALAAVIWHFAASNATAPVSTPNAVQASDMSANEAFDHYIERGRDEGVVVNELPTRVLVDVRDSPDGGYQLLYLRQVLERVQVPDLYMIEDAPQTERPDPVEASFVNNTPSRGPM